MAVTLHEEIERVLRMQGAGPLSARQLADAVSAAGRYAKRDGSRVSPQQIHARVSKHPELFERALDGIRLRRDRAALSPPTAPTAPSDGQPWYWEGNVQAALAKYLAAQGWRVERAADTATRERGIDLVAVKGVQRLAVEVKGYPVTTYARGPKAGQRKPTAPTNQARHWFAQALLAAVLSGDQFPKLALAFPDFPRYRELIERSRWALRALEITIYLVAENGAVERIGRG